MALLHSRQSHTWSTMFSSIYCNVCLLMVPIECCLLIIHFLPGSSDFLPAAFLHPDIISLSMCTLSIHLLSSSRSLSKMAIAVFFLSILSMPCISACPVNLSANYFHSFECCPHALDGKFTLILSHVIV